MQYKKYTYKGLIIALTIISLWSISLYFFMNIKIDWSNPLMYVFVAIQTHLYTGLFITTHDSIHGVVAPYHPKTNRFIGILTATLFLFNPYHVLEKKHHEHHQHVNTADDPDVHQGNFFVWLFKFMLQYIKWYQLLAASITYNLLKPYFPAENLMLFWMLPSFLSTLQLFVFGTYLPHRGDHHHTTQSRSQSKNHLFAFFSCYFFGYHHEHHAFPYLPWWMLPKAKEIDFSKTQAS